MHLNNKKFLFSGFFTIVFIALSAQTFSPYSQYGLGLQRNPVFSGNKGTGGLSAGYATSRTINFLNPASYAALDYTVFELGATTATHILSENSTKISEVTNGGVNHFAMAFPVMKNRWGLSFGLLPFSYVNYRFSETGTLGNENFTSTNSGEGSTYQFYIGNGVKFGNFHVGINAGYFFGGLEYYNAATFAPNSEFRDVRTVNKIRPNDFMVNTGIQYRVNLSSIDKSEDKQDVYLTVGVYGAPQLNIGTSVSSYLEATRPSAIAGNTIPIDTAAGGIFDSKQSLKLPASLGTGFTVGNELSWLAGLDFHYENWKNFTSPIHYTPLLNEWKVKAGFQATPKYNGNRLSQRIEYRLGAHLGKTRVNLQNEAMPEFGTTFGLGLPFKRASSLSRSLSVLNLTMEIGRRGIVADEILKENYYQLTIAYSLSDRWFQKRKFD
jgi:hypothetical protein